MPAATAHARHDASGLWAGRAHVGHLFLRSGGSDGTCFALFVCEGNEADCYLGPAFGAPLLIRIALSALDAMRMARSGMMHRGCGRPVRTLRTFCDDRAAPTTPALHFLCAKEME